MFYIEHLKIIILDKIRLHMLGSISNTLYLLSIITLPFCKSKALKLLMQSHRINPTKNKSLKVKKNIKSIIRLSEVYIPDNVNKEGTASRSIILKQPEIMDGAIQKGVLLITFTATFGYYFYHMNLRKLLKYYTLILEPSWAGYCDPQILFFCQYKDPVIVQSTELLDREFLDTIDTNLKAVDFGASDWVDHSTFKPIDNITKKYDCLYVANYNSIKRIEIYLRALREIKVTCPEFKAALVCAKWGANREYYLKLINKYGLNDILDRFEGLSKSELNQTLNQSRVNILLSLKEGSNRSLFESMFAGTPVIALKNNIGINKDYINRHTGKLIEDRELADTLLYFRDNHSAFRPRDWALANISPEATTEKLRRALSRHTGANLDNLNLAVKTNNPEVNYYEDISRDKIQCNLHLLGIFGKGNFDYSKFLNFLQEYP